MSGTLLRRCARPTWFLLLLLWGPTACAQETGAVATVIPASLASIAVEPDTAVYLRPGEVFHFQGRVLEEGIASAALRWRSSDPGIAAIDPATGVAVGTGPGSARIWAVLDLSATARGGAGAAASGGALLDTDLVVFPSPEVEALLGPQLRAGSGANPWPWFDRNASAHGAKLWDDGSARDRANGYYYDHALAQYLNYYRTGDPAFRERARAAADHWYASSRTEAESSGGYSPREAALTGMMLRALDGRPEYWDFLTREAERHYDIWLGRRLDAKELHYGIRDGGYALIFAAQLAQVHPDPQERERFRQRASDAATRYFVRLQHEDGGWYWRDDGSEKAPGGVWEQPFMVGLLLEGLVAVHQMTGDPLVERAILRSVDHLWSRYRSEERVREARGQGVAWRQVAYFNYLDGSFNGELALEGGWDTNTIREGRQRNTLIIHAFGYAYQLTRDPRYRSWGDEIFAATFGNGEGPGADPFYSLADFRGKEYNQAYRSAGRYLVWRQNE